MKRTKTMDDRVKEVVSSAVIQALGGDCSGLLAEITADVLNKKVSDEYGAFSYMMGGRDGNMSYLQRLARDEVKKHVQAAVAEWFAARKSEIRQAVVDRINAENIADAYISKLNDIFAEGLFTVDVEVSASERDSADD